MCSSLWRLRKFQGSSTQLKKWVLKACEYGGHKPEPEIAPEPSAWSRGLKALAEVIE